MLDIKKIKFDNDGLVPAIVCDAYTNRVLMQAYMNNDALAKTLKTKKAHYYSRSRKTLWLKGESSGHTQEVVSIFADCDYDCILLRVKQNGHACHVEGQYSCFHNEETVFQDVSDIGILHDVLTTIADRQKNPVEGAYTNYLFSKGVEKICKKVGEEASEVIIASMKNDNAELHQEAADLLYHLLVLLKNQKTDLVSVLKVLESRKK